MVLTEPTELTAIMSGWEHRSPSEALDEVARELAVRERCFPRWIKEGRISRTDAVDRLQRLTKAAFLLNESVNPSPTTTEEQGGSNGEAS